MILGGAEEKGLRFTLNISANLHKYYKGDPLRISQILMNLLNNAVKFTEKGSVELRVSQQADGSLLFCVEDSGVGIPQDKWQTIFQPFVQADSSITRKFGGTGLGLSICRGLVEKMGGRLWIESEVGRGSRFFFILNLPKAQKEDVEPDVKPKVSEKSLALKDGGKRKILLVDDDISNKEIMQIYLKNLQVDLHWVQNGQMAVEAVSGENFDLILMDMQMPVMDGLMATRKIREYESAKNKVPIPILMLTANAFKENMEASLSAGASDFLTKPIKKNQLISALEKFV